MENTAKMNVEQVQAEQLEFRDSVTEGYLREQKALQEQLG